VFGGEFGVVDVEAGGVPGFHFFHGVVGGGEGFFSLDSGYPGVDGLVIVREQFIEIFLTHETQLRPGVRRRQGKGVRFTEC
jgi:hypothetical protein